MLCLVGCGFSLRLPPRDSRLAVHKSRGLMTMMSDEGKRKAYQLSNRQPGHTSLRLSLVRVNFVASGRTVLAGVASRRAEKTDTALHTNHRARTQGTAARRGCHFRVYTVRVRGTSEFPKWKSPARRGPPCPSH